NPPLAASARFLAEQVALRGLVGSDIQRLALGLDRKPALDARTCLHARDPGFQMRKLLDVLALAFPATRPSDAGDVRDGKIAREIVPVDETLVHDAVQTVRLVGVALDAVRDLFRRIE